MSQPPVDPDWEEIRLAWETSPDSVAAIARCYGIKPFGIHYRSKAHGWGRRRGVTTRRRRAPPGLHTATGAKRFLVRMSNTMTLKLAALEAQFEVLDELTPQDAERFDRSIRMMMQNLEKVQMLNASSKQPSGSAKSRSQGKPGAKSPGKGSSEIAGTDPFDVKRGELARRIRQLHEQWLARRGAGGSQSG